MNTIHGLADVSPVRRFVRGLGRAALTSTMIGFAIVSTATAQQSFKTPQEAAETLVTAVRAGDRKAVHAILGPGAEQIISSGDAVQDENARKVFLAAYDAQHSVKTSDDKPATLLIGPDDYPFAIPIAKKGDSWMFDTAAGRQEWLRFAPVIVGALVIVTLLQIPSAISLARRLRRTQDQRPVWT